MEAVRTFETSANFYRATRRKFPENKVQDHRRENSMSNVHVYDDGDASFLR
jgi:hypothetical protein